MKPGDSWNKRENPLEKMREHQAQAVAQRRELLERLQSQPKPLDTNKTPPSADKLKTPALDVDAAIGAARLLHLMTLEARCLIPLFNGALFSCEWRDALWARFYTGAPRRQRQSVEQYKIVKRA